MIQSFKDHEAEGTNGGSVSRGWMVTPLGLRSSIITRSETMKTKKLEPVHPGEVLREEFLLPLGLSQNRVAIDIGVPARRINEIVLEKRRITADTALRLGKFFGNTPQFWLGLQADYDLDLAEDLLRGRIECEVRPYAKAG